MTGSKKFIVTLNHKTQKLISIIEVAGFEYSGSATAVADRKIPWFPTNESCINENWAIKSSPDSYDSHEYQIKSNGKIEKIK